MRRSSHLPKTYFFYQKDVIKGSNTNEVCYVVSTINIPKKIITFNELIHSYRENKG